VKTLLPISDALWLLVIRNSADDEFIQKEDDELLRSCSVSLLRTYFYDSWKQSACACCVKKGNFFVVDKKLK
jgi:hypothetical protein